jgi:hypothetical protein
MVMEEQMRFQKDEAEHLRAWWNLKWHLLHVWLNFEPIPHTNVAAQLSRRRRGFF